MRTKGVVGTPLWMAPEIIAGERRYGPSADVYSFGIVMWEIAARDKPWSEVQDDFLLDALLRVITSGQRPAVDSEWPYGYVAVMRQCWATDPQSRPTFDQVAAQLREDVQVPLFFSHHRVIIAFFSVSKCSFLTVIRSLRVS